MSIPITYKDKIYNSIRQACKDLGLEPNGTARYLRMGYSLDYVVKRKLEKDSIVCDGIKFRSIKECVRFYGVPYSTVFNRVVEGWSLEDAVKGRKRSLVSCDGIEFNSLKECTRFYGVPYPRVLKRLQNGFSLKEALMEIDYRNKETKREMSLGGR